MFALLQNGPAAGQQIQVDDPPPRVVRVEVPLPDHARLVEIPEAGAYPETSFELHPYRFIGLDRLPSPTASSGFTHLALYVSAPELEAKD